MTYMEIATYLGFDSTLLKNVVDNVVDDENKDMLDNVLTAVLEAQMIMYELAREELKEQVILKGGTE